MRGELAEQLVAFVFNARSLASLQQWFASLDWNEVGSIDEANREELGLFELLVTEVAEGSRPGLDLTLAAGAWLIEFGFLPSWLVFSSAAGSSTVDVSLSEKLFTSLQGQSEKSVWNIQPQWALSS